MTVRDDRRTELQASALKHSACNIVTNDQKDTHAAKPSSEAVDLRAYVYVALMVLLGSTTAAAAKFAVAELPVSLVPALRFGLAGLCLLPWVMGRGVLRRMVREDALLLLVSAALCVPINQGFFLSATRLGPTSHVGIFYATCPLVVLLLAWSLRIEKPDRGRLWGVLASVAGIVVIAIGNFWGAANGSPAEVRADRARRPLAGGRGIVVGSLYRDQQAARRQARCDASRRRDGFGRLLAFTSHRGLELAGLG